MSSSLLARILKVGVQIFCGPKVHIAWRLWRHARREVWVHAPSENFEKLKPLRRDFRDSDSCKRLSIYLLNRLFIAAGKVAWGRLCKSITLNSGFACEIASINFDSFDQNRKKTR